MSTSVEATGTAQELAASDDDDRLPLATIFAYGLPAAGVGFTFLLFTLYLVNYSTDVLLVAPAVIGTLFAIARFWDAISDPVAGYLSDRTRTRSGRRRSWMFASALPLGITFFMLWNPAPGLGELGVAVWIGASLLLYSTAYTIFAIPHEAMGAELTPSYHERTRLFGVKHLIQTGGSFVALGALYLLTTAGDPRASAFWVTGIGGAATAAVIVLAVAFLRERPDYQGRGGTGILKAFGDVGRNAHARLLLIVFGIENLGSASIGVLTPFAAKYIVKQPEMTVPALAAYFIPNILFPYVWIRVSRRIGKKKLWLFSMSAMTLGFGGLFFLDEGDGWLMATLGAVAGIGGSCGAVVGPSVKADVIDYDEYQTGERKEGAYFAVWNFVRKSAVGVTAMITGFALQLSGFVPNVDQTEQARFAILALYGLFPGVCYLIGTLLFSRFSLNEEEHARIRTELEARAAAGGARPQA
ncbi:MAG: glycoside-pentoside-hexuronide (GPH):cation symporter [Myxococcota bacterium]